jgi:hypothetical protein
LKFPRQPPIAEATSGTARIINAAFMTGSKTDCLLVLMGLEVP